MFAAAEYGSSSGRGRACNVLEDIMGLLEQTGDRMRNYTGGENSGSLGHLPTAGLRIIPSDAFLWASGGSILLSLGLRILGRKNDSLFVGAWAPTLVGLGVLARLARR